MEERIEKTENFAKKIISLAVEEKLSVAEFFEATNMARRISSESMVDDKCIDKIDYPSSHIVTKPENPLFG